MSAIRSYKEYLDVCKRLDELIYLRVDSQEVEDLHHQILDFEVKHHLVCPNCKSPDSGSPNCYECAGIYPDDFL